MKGCCKSHAMNIYQTKFEENDAGGVPLDCPNSFKKVERKRLKKMRVPWYMELKKNGN